MSELLERLETEIRHTMGIGTNAKTPFHDEILAVASEMERKDATIKALADALEHVSKSSVNERVWNEATDKVDDMQEIVRAALRLAGRL